VPYLLVVGDRERDNGQVAVRALNGEDLGVMTLEQFIAKLRAETEKH
jgi:threonyl-tRNA synthetase